MKFFIFHKVFDVISNDFYFRYLENIIEPSVRGASILLTCNGATRSANLSHNYAILLYLIDLYTYNLTRYLFVLSRKTFHLFFIIS